MTEFHLELLLRDAIATEILGAALGRAFVATAHGAADSGTAMLYLLGELGSGKTTCVRSLLRTLGVEGVIRSPTYTLVETYELAAFNCVHVDLYRLGGVAEVDPLGLRDYLDGDCLLLVEWPEKGGAALPPADVELRLSYHLDARIGRAEARSPRGRLWLDKLVHDTSLSPYVSNIT